MASWTVPALVVSVDGFGELLRLWVQLAPDVRVGAVVRLALPDAPHEPLRPSPGARLFVERAVPPGSRIWFSSDRLDRCRRPMGRCTYGPRLADLATDLLLAGLAVPARRPGG